MRDLGQFHPVSGQMSPVRQIVVLLPVHENPRKWQSEEAVHEPAVVGELDHGLEDWAHCRGADLVVQAGGVEGARVVGRGPHPSLELIEEALRIGVVVTDDLAAEEAILRRHIAIDVHEAEPPGRVLVGQQQDGVNVG